MGLLSAIGLDVVGKTIGGILKPLGDIAQGWTKRKSMKVESQLKIMEAETAARVNYLATAQMGDIAWETKSIDNSGWKDEWFVILISIPAIMCFCGPTAADWVRDGFAALAGCPQWYQWAFSIAFGSAFGVKEFTKFKRLQKGD